MNVVILEAAALIMTALLGGMETVCGARAFMKRRAGSGEAGCFIGVQQFGCFCWWAPGMRLRPLLAESAMVLPGQDIWRPPEP